MSAHMVASTSMNTATGARKVSNLSRVTLARGTLALKEVQPAVHYSTLSAGVLRWRTTNGALHLHRRCVLVRKQLGVLIYTREAPQNY